MSRPKTGKRRIPQTLPALPIKAFETASTRLVSPPEPLHPLERSFGLPHLNRLGSENKITIPGIRKKSVTWSIPINSSPEPDAKRDLLRSVLKRGMGDLPPLPPVGACPGGGIAAHLPPSPTGNLGDRTMLSVHADVNAHLTEEQGPTRTWEIHMKEVNVSRPTFELPGPGRRASQADMQSNVANDSSRAHDIPTSRSAVSSAGLAARPPSGRRNTEHAAFHARRAARLFNGGKSG